MTARRVLAVVVLTVDVGLFGSLVLTMDRADLRGPTLALLLVALNLFAISELFQ